MTVFVDRGAQNGSKDLANVAATDLSTELFFNSQIAIMKSKEVAQEAFNALNLKDNPAFKDLPRPVDAFRSVISVQRQRDSALFDISVTAPHKDEVAAWANAVAKAYDEVTLNQKLHYLREADKVMTDQAARLEQEYQKLQQQYGTYLAKTGNYFPANERAITDSRIQGLELRRNDVLIQKNAVEAKLGQLRTIQTDGRDPLAIVSIQEDPVIQDLTRQYNQAQKDLAQLSAQFTNKHPLVIKKKEEIAALQRRIRDQALNILHATESQYASLSQEYASLTQDLDSLKVQAISTTEGSTQSESLQAGVQAIRKYMDLLTDKMREVDVAASLTSNVARTVDKAETPTHPSKPNKKMVVLLSFMLGLMGSVGSVLLVRALDTRVKAPEEMERRFGLSAFGVIPVKTEENLPMLQEAFLSLRTSLIYASDHKARRLWMVTSPSAGEGKSTIVVNLGITLAAAGDRVLLMDCDVRKPTLYRHFGKPMEAGLSAYLASDDEDYKGYLSETGKPGLWLMTSGKSPANPPSLFD
ncbi:MAG: hypothetical protein B7X11_02780, partial [Acidobacteria bacterium 37-65-4]